MPRTRRKPPDDLGTLACWVASVAVAHVIYADPSPLELYALTPEQRQAVEQELLRIADQIEGQ